MSNFIDNEDGQPNPVIASTHAFIQYKNTNICMDFRCDCGEQSHYDGDFADAVECPNCHQQWEMPQFIVPRKVCAGTYPGHVETIKVLVSEDDG
ncbi:hypothetical protein [Sphingobium lignivorans]|uniref:Uncharacterized protein n=1 Tax=Sphingobium lignivorans TaxID=2735886 RepID=A0ABR6NFC5_9SPHN|nr:hypothetical protein [Sphingobium lignivorans]MBB5985966.1 hypothetical protein [Sphingobium lignivorans]